MQKGGRLVGIGEPSALAQPGQLFKLAQVFGLDRDGGERLANGKYKFAKPEGAVGAHFITADAPADTALDFGKDIDGIYVFGPDTQVLAERDGAPRLATHAFGQGRAVYLSGFKFTFENTRLLHRALFWAAAQEAKWTVWNTTNIKTECSYFAKAGKLVVINNASEPQQTEVTLTDGRTTKALSLEAHGIAILDV